MEGKKIDWIYHYVRNHACNSCGADEEYFLPYICDAQTHGMTKYDHLEFQVVLEVGPGLIGYLLNTMGLRVMNGERFKDGDIITGITSDEKEKDLPLRLKEVMADGNPVLRIILPDGKNKFPDDEGCEEPYSLQHLPEDMLRRPKEGGAEC